MAEFKVKDHPRPREKPRRAAMGRLGSMAAIGGFGGSFAATLAVSRTVRIHKGIILTDLSAKFDAEEFQSKEAEPCQSLKYSSRTP